MILNVAVDGQSVDINVPDSMLSEARDFFQKVDSDLDKGYQMGQFWVENPNPEQRCQIAANDTSGKCPISLVPLCLPF